MKSIVLTLVVFAIVATHAFGSDPVIGTWKMNVEKSTFSPGPAPKNVTVTYSQEGDWIVMKAEGVDEKGAPISRSNRYKMDGKEYPFDGPYGPSKMMVKKMGDTVEMVTKPDAGGAITSRATYSADGKTRTVTATGMNAKGEKVNNVIVFERQ